MADLRFANRRWNWDLIGEIRMWSRAEVLDPPVWLFAAQLNPPYPMVQVPRPGIITFPEDRLRKKWMARHPDASEIRWKSKYVGEHIYWQHPATSFVERQLIEMRRGHSEEEARKIVDEQDRRAQKLRDLERWIAIEQMHENFPGLTESVQAKIDFTPSHKDPNPRATLLREIIEEFKMRNILTPLDPQLIPKDMDLGELLGFIRQYPEYVHYFNIPLLVTYIQNEDVAPLADALMYIYGTDTEEEAAPHRERLHQLATIVAETEAEMQAKAAASGCGDDEEEPDPDPETFDYSDPASDYYPEGLSEHYPAMALMTEEQQDERFHQALDELLDDFHDADISEPDMDIFKRLMNFEGRGEADKNLVEHEMLRMQRVITRLRKVPRVHDMRAVKAPTWRLITNLLALRPRRPMTANELAEARKALDAAKLRRKQEEEERERKERSERRAALEAERSKRQADAKKRAQKMPSLY